MSEGDQVPADARLLESVRLGVDEAVLTGEGEPAEKSPAVLSRETQIGDQRNMLSTDTLELLPVRTSVSAFALRSTEP